MEGLDLGVPSRRTLLRHALLCQANGGSWTGVGRRGTAMVTRAAESSSCQEGRGVMCNLDVGSDLGRPGERRRDSGRPDGSADVDKAGQSLNGNVEITNPGTQAAEYYIDDVILACLLCSLTRICSGIPAISLSCSPAPCEPTSDPETHMQHTWYPWGLNR